MTKTKKKNVTKKWKNSAKMNFAEIINRNHYLNPFSDEQNF